MERNQEIRYTEIEKTDAYIYDKVEMKVRVEEIYEVVIKDLDGISFIKRAVAPYIKAVSYTHLDVYKRQAIRRFREADGKYLP